jgi:uncharacterized protein YkwD
MGIHFAAARCLPLIALLCLPAGAETTDSSQRSLTLAQARAYMITLINRDRHANGAAPVVLDAGASLGAQSHTDEMVKFGYLSHWGLDGKKPTERYSEAGGADSDMENATYDYGYYGNPGDTNGLLPVTQDPTFSPAELEAFEAGFMNEPKNQVNHRSNILDPNHTRVGIAMSRAISNANPGADNFYRVALTQEFIDGYGSYSSIPANLQPGAGLRVAGTLVPGFALQSVELRKEALPSPMTIAELMATYSVQSAPDNTFADYFPGDSNSGLVVSATANGQAFSVPVDTHSWQPGLYYLEVWATNKDLGTLCVSRRTIVVPTVKPAAAPAAELQWKPWRTAHEGVPQLSHVHMRKGCAPAATPNAQQQWTVQYSNDDPSAAYKIVFQLVADGESAPGDWPAHAFTVRLPPAGKTPSTVSGQFAISADCTSNPRLYDSIDRVADTGAQH